MRNNEATTVQLNELRVVETERQIRMIRFTPDGQMLLAACYDGAIRRWRTPDGNGAEPESLEPIDGHNGFVESLAAAPDGKTLYAVDSWGQLAAWPLADERPEPVWRRESAHDGWIRTLSLSDDGLTLITAGRDRVVRVWRAADGELLHELVGHDFEVYAAALHPDGQSAASGDLMGHVKRWNLESGECVAETQLDDMHYYERIQDVAGIRALRFRDEGRTLVCSGSDPTKTGRAFGIPSIRFLEWPSLEVSRTLQLGPDKNGYVFDIDWHPDGYLMAVLCGPPGAGKLVLWRPDEEQPFLDNSKLFNPHSLAVHPPSHRLVVSATNRNSQGNGAVLDKQGAYLGNSSPLHFFEIQAEGKGFSFPSSCV